MEINPSPLIMSIPKALREGPLRWWSWMIIDECMIADQIEDTHIPGFGTNDDIIDLNSILSIIKNMLRDCHISPSQQVLDDETKFVDEVVKHEINRLSPELAYMGSEDEDLHAKTVQIFNKLPNYPWEAKLGLVIASLVTNYAEYWVVAQSNPNDPLTKTMRLFKEMGPTPAQQSHFDVFHGLILSTLDLIEGVAKIKDTMMSWPSDYDESTASIASIVVVIACYWTVRSAVASVPFVHSLFARDCEPCASKERQLGVMSRKLKTLLNCLQDHGSTQKMKSVMDKGNYDKMKDYAAMRRAFEEKQVDNMLVLYYLFNCKATQIIDCSNNQLVDLEALKKKKVVLLITPGIEIPNEMLHNLALIWEKRNKYPEADAYRMIWLPVTETRPTRKKWTEEDNKKYIELRSKMPFYSVNDPRSTHPTATRILKERFGFKRETILGVIDEVGKIVHHNALNMLWTWGHFGNFFPLTEYEENKRLDDVWNLNSLLLGGIEEETSDQVSDSKIVLIMGGYCDMESIQRTQSMVEDFNDKKYKDDKKTQMVVYICKRSNRKKGKATDIVNNLIYKSNNSFLLDDNKVWLFWTRVESMILSRIRNTMTKEDEITNELKKLLSYEGFDDNNNNNKIKPWGALFVKGDTIVEDDGLRMLEAIVDIRKKKEFSSEKCVDDPKGFIKERITTTASSSSGDADGGGGDNDEYGSPFRLDFTTSSKNVVGDLNCVVCRKSMQKFNSMVCCHPHITNNS